MRKEAKQSNKSNQQNTFAPKNKRGARRGLTGVGQHCLGTSLVSSAFTAAEHFESQWSCGGPGRCQCNKRSNSAVMPSLSTLILQLGQHRFSIKEKHYTEIPGEPHHRGQFSISFVTDQRTSDAHLSEALPGVTARPPWILL